MQVEHFIGKRQPEPDGLDFEGLRREGIRLVQELSGDVWTDYNLHDPGVTLLEQICYGLTDLVYRTGFPVADFLVSGDDHRIHFDRLALYRPEEALSCGPITEDDYRRLILDSVPNVENVWIGKPSRGAGSVEGLHRIHLQLSERVRQQDHEGVERTYGDAVRKLFAANRNLCEDLAEVRLAKRIPYRLRGEVEMDGNRSPATILGEIYFRCARYLSPRVMPRPYQEAYASGASLDELFTGVVTRGGYIPDEELHPWRGHFSIQELSGMLLGIEGVRRIRTLEFVDAESNEATDCINLRGDDLLPIACLQLPSAEGADGVTLIMGENACHASLADVETEFNRLNYGAEAGKGRRSRFDWIAAMLPKGEFRPLDQYSSVQNHLPEIYGVGTLGIGDYAPPERKAAAAQLKAYLLFFEQVMADFLQNARNIPSLFSSDEQPVRSYFHEVLGADAVPGVEKVYRYGMDAMKSKLEEVAEAFDDFPGRKNRVLDYLLGLYGESFSQRSLRQHFGDDVHHDVETMRNKVSFLKNVIEIGKKRAAGFDYRKPAGGANRAGLQRKLVILLGLDGAEAGFHLVEHVLLRPTSGAAQGTEDARDFHSFRFSVVFPADVGRYTKAEFRKLVEETVAINAPAYLCPTVVWLDAARFNAFETLLDAWQQARRKARATDSEIDAAAASLVRFLRDQPEAADE